MAKIFYRYKQPASHERPMKTDDGKKSHRPSGKSRGSVSHHEDLCVLWATYPRLNRLWVNL